MRTNFYYHCRDNGPLGMGTSTSYNDFKVKCWIHSKTHAVFSLIIQCDESAIQTMYM